MELSTFISVIIAILTCVQNGNGRKSSFSEPSTAERKAYPLLTSIVKTGGHRGLEECQKQFKNEVWNCTMDNKKPLRELPIFFKTTLPHATRETALLHAISTAAITHEITRQCTEDKIPGCRCIELKNRHPKGGDGDWQWGGCSDNVGFGENMTKSFIDNLEQDNGARRAVNLHNNELGRKIVRLSLKRECKCHGVTGSCNFKTCWRSLAPFSVVGAELKKKYRQAARVTLVDGVLRGQDNKPVTRRDRKLVFLDLSPDYCVRNKTAGSLGLLGRTCGGDGVSTSKCRSLCNSCNLAHKTVELTKEVKCRCKFVWCCSVECQTCTREVSLTTCTRQ